MFRFYAIFICIFLSLSASVQADGKKDFLSIQDAMSIVSYRRMHPMINNDELSAFVREVIGQYDYTEEDFLEGIGTFTFWQFIKHGHIINDENSYNDDDYFVPDDKSLASTVAIVDCCGIETIENDETAISVEMRVFTETKRDEILKDILSLGFIQKGADNNQRLYTWKSFSIRLFEGISRGHKFFEFDVTLNVRDFNSTKHYEFADSSRAYNLKIHADYPVDGNPKLLRRIRTFIMEALEKDIMNDWPMARYNGDPSDGQAVINYYGNKGCVALKNKHEPYVRAFEEETTIRKVAENENFVSYEVLRLGWYGGVLNVKNYGASFRKSDGKRLSVIANPEAPQFKHFLNNQVYFEKKDEIYEEYKNNLPMPKYEPYMIQSGIRFVYQKYEIASGAAEIIKGEVSFSEIQQFLSEEVKDVLNN